MQIRWSPLVLNFISAATCLSWIWRAGGDEKKLRIYVKGEDVKGRLAGIISDERSSKYDGLVQMVRISATPNASLHE